MKKRVLYLLCVLALTLAGCGPARQPADGQEGPRLTVVATTYPVYLFASALTEGVDDVEVARLNTGETSCLHDYTLSVSDMKKLARADVIAMNGVGLEEFMEDALATSKAAVIDCSQGAQLLETLGHVHEEEEAGKDGHDHGHFDPHIWMDPENAILMVENLEKSLSQADPDHEADYRSNAQKSGELLRTWGDEAKAIRNAVEISGLITFHDGFQYFAAAYDLPLLESIEEEAGSEASAHEIVEISELVKEKRIPVIFTETNGSDATAKAISRETGCQVATLTMLMDGPNDGKLTNYRDGLMNNINAIVNGFAGEGSAR